MESEDRASWAIRRPTVPQELVAGRADNASLVGTSDDALVALCARLASRSAPCRAFHETFVHPLLRFWGAVMERAEPLIERNNTVRIIALEIFMMEQVRVTICFDVDLIADEHLVETRIGYR